MQFRSGDTMRWWGHLNPTLCKRIVWIFFAITGGRDGKNSGTSPSVRARATWWNFHYLILLMSLKTPSCTVSHMTFWFIEPAHPPSLLVATIATEDQKYWRRIHRSRTSSSSWAVRRRCRLCGCSPDSGSVSTSPAPFPTHWNENSEG